MSVPDPDPPSPTTSRKRRWMAPLLVASLAMNLVVAGAAVSGFFWGTHGESGFHRSSDLLPRSFFRSLDDERREELRAAFRPRKPEFREERSGLRDAAEALAEALDEEPFDPKLAQAAIEDHARRSHRLIDFVADFAGDLIQSLTPEERSALADAIRRRVEADRERSARHARRSH
jgi:uncharacterized membrane protein